MNKLGLFGYAFIYYSALGLARAFDNVAKNACILQARAVEELNKGIVPSAPVNTTSKVVN